MDDQRFGGAVRAARVRRRRRQSDVAAASGVSDSTVSRIERGHLETLSLRAIRAVAAVLEIRIELLPRSRGAELDRLLGAHHAALAEAVIEWLTGFAGWKVRPEMSFSYYGDRGVIDLLAWHSLSRSLLVIELKTDIVDVGELLGTFDRKLRNAMRVAVGLGWNPLTVSGLLIIAESDLNRAKIGTHDRTFGVAFPDRHVAIRRWLRNPAGSLRGLMFFANRHAGQATAPLTATRRVRLRFRGPPDAEPRTDRA
jgi:transcriptional regulator with XRE-family HTH domain